MSSDIFSKEINVADFDIIYAGAQKNLGPAGATLFIVKDSILGKSTSPFMPTYLDLKQQVEKESMLNTPPVFSVYVAMLNLRNLMANGGVKAMEARNNAKAELLGAVKYPVLPLNQLLYVVGVITVGTNGEKGWVKGAPPEVIVKLFALLSTKRLFWNTSKLVFVSAVKGCVLGVKLLVYLTPLVTLKFEK
jgi:hypothetical protein